MRRLGYFSLAKTFIALVVAGATLSGCSSGSSSGGGGSSTKPITSYCPYLPSKTFSSGVTVNGKAYFEFRTGGNGAVSDSRSTVTVNALTADTYTLSINGTAVSSNCAVACTASQGASAMASAINASSSLPVTASYTSGATFSIRPKTEGDPITLSGAHGLTYASHDNPAPIRYAEVRVTDSSGDVIQCAETSSTGTFSFQLPSGGDQFTIYVVSRANNAHNNAYVMNNPTDNEFYSISTTVTASGSPAPVLLAKATSAAIEGGAFNILDQIYKAQAYLRAATEDCDSAPSANYYADCDPFPNNAATPNSLSSSYAPLVYVYWTAGLTPGIYEGVSGPISYYLNGQQELYILGGVDGDTEVADMDHFDNSVIIHEYGHFIEDQFADPNSPGGSHNGDAIIDPRLAWGEGWANFFQAAVQVGSSRVDLQACKLEYSIVSPK